MELQFEWDLKKAESNYSKHGIRFELAFEIFDDPFCILEQDRVVDGEERWKALGVTMTKERLLMVACVFKLNADSSEIVRIISARRADKDERKLYEHGSLQKKRSSKADKRVRG